MEKLMNKMDDMEMDKVSGGKHDASARPRSFPLHDSNANSMAANVDETQNASACVGK